MDEHTDDRDPTVAAGIVRRRWVTPQVIVAAAQHSAAGEGIYRSDFTTTHGGLYTS